MTKVLITEDYLTNIGNSIRKENQTTTKYKPSEMANAIETNNANVATRVAAETEILNTQTKKEALSVILFNGQSLFYLVKLIKYNPSFAPIIFISAK